MSKKKERGNFVYSTNPDFGGFEDDLNLNQDEDVLPSKQKLYVSIDRKQRGGKEVTLVEGFIGSDEALKDLGKTLKSKLGVGGSAKDSEIIIQGNFKLKVYDMLIKMGYTQTKQKGGN